MKQELDNSKVYLDKDELNMLFKEVKETVAVDISSNLEKENKNIFSTADLWKIQRMKNKNPEKGNNLELKRKAVITAFLF